MKRRDISFNLLKKRSVFITTTTVAIERDIDPSFETQHQNEKDVPQEYALISMKIDQS